MRSFTAIATASLAVLASANNMVKRDDASCMTQAQAQKVADNFQSLIADYDASVAEAALSPTFHDYSDSVSSLIDNGCTGPQPVSLTPNHSQPPYIPQPLSDVCNSSAKQPSPPAPTSWPLRVLSPQSPSSS